MSQLPTGPTPQGQCDGQFHHQRQCRQPYLVLWQMSALPHGRVPVRRFITGNEGILRGQDSPLAVALFKEVLQSPGGMLRGRSRLSSGTCHLLLSSTDQSIDPSCGIFHSARQSNPGSADSSAPQAAGPALPPGSAPPPRGPHAPRLPARE